MSGRKPGGSEREPARRAVKRLIERLFDHFSQQATVDEMEQMRLR